METKKCNKCGKVKPLAEMDRRRDKKKQGSLNTCLFASLVRLNIQINTYEKTERKLTGNNANGQRESEKRRTKGLSLKKW